ncbi:predicted protein [Sclerotinia sclerotiorum 1980 UF-70]|uniref:Uncharacterized protein n=1 Tax=Sclerotinia sclerotiorum (strain ATCC 18683 / 1980 / Ss-1) TaxID=665079 RepID=A7EXG7_SCLS1|nr:predicted protein [Sclerotinia sclerotiorum 1980 UF-70]EDN94159.1 predicted protein [Sclerotinia sclerotiorum 1980 UF-70]
MAVTHPPHLCTSIFCAITLAWKTFPSWKLGKWTKTGSKSFYFERNQDLIYFLTINGSHLASSDKGIKNDEVIIDQGETNKASIPNHKLSEISIILEWSPLEMFAMICGLPALGKFSSFEDLHLKF